MKIRTIHLIALVLAAVTGTAGAAVITVNTADNTDFSAGKTNLVYALTNISDGDTIAFNISGAGPHYLQTPPNGYPILIKDRVTVDGYSQPGSSRNSNPITAANNAQIKIVLDSRNGNYRDMEYTLFTLANSSPPIDNTSMATERGGYGFPEKATLGIYRATNVVVRGLAFLGTFEEGSYGIAVAHDYGLDTSVKDRLAYDAGSSRNCHINGCWFGIDPTNQTVAGLAPFQDGIAFFRHRDASGGTRPELPNESLIVGVKAGSANPRAEFNVISYMFLGMAGEAVRTRFSGNFLGVMPDGVTPTGVPGQFDGGFEIGRYDDTQPIVVGTDGDGVNDADEGNLFGPLTGGGVVLSFYSTGNKPYIVAGNRFGRGVDGSRWPNSQVIWDGIGSATKVQFGSDFNGVSDAAEGNVVYNNFPFDTNSLPRFFVLSAGAQVSFRGNSLVNNNLVPYSYADGLGTRLTAFTNYCAPFMSTAAGVIPVLSPYSSSIDRIVGTCAASAGGSFSNIIVDVYELDPEGWANGVAVGFVELNGSGFPQGKTYLGSFVDNGPLDSDPAVASFKFNITSLALTPGKRITVTANYSADPPGTTQGRTHTSNFSDPVTLVKAIYVTTTDNGSPAGLATAMASAQAGDTIRFDIPGPGPHYLQTPAGGYPLITKSGLTIDGYSQPGSVPNTNPILSSNNAQIQIVLTSTNGNYTSMDYNSDTNSQAGFGPGEFALLGILRATNIQIRGLCLLGNAAGGVISSHFGIAIARDRFTPSTDVHVNGCWIGVDPTGTNVSDFDDGIHASSHRFEASYRFRGTNGATLCGYDVTLNNRNPNTSESDRDLINIFNATNTCAATNHTVTINASAGRYVHFNHVIGVKPGSSNPRSEFNVIVGGTIPIIMEGYGFRVSGNFLGVLPDGVTQYLVPFSQVGRFAESFIEIGRGASDIVIGTDGDGVNDADERNVIAGVVTDGSRGSFNLNGYRHSIELYSQSGALNASGTTGEDRQRVRVAGNYVGIGVDGVTRFTNGVPILNGSAVNGTHYWIGSDFDGVSDDIERNVFYGNYPPGLFYSTAYTNSTQSGSGSHGFLDEPTAGAGGYSTRGNTIVNCYPYPWNPRRGEGLASTSFNDIRTYVNKALAVAQPATVAGYYALFPVISASSTTGRLIGTAPANNATYPYLILDVYLPDPEGLTNGLVVPDPYLTNGWVYGKTYLASFTDNSSADLDPNPGAFAFNICSLGLPSGTPVTISANYSKDAPGTHNARVLTSLFSNPVTLPIGVVITSATRSGNMLTLEWCGGSPPYTVQQRTLITDPWTDLQTGLTATTFSTAISGNSGFYRVVGKSN